MDLPPPPPPPHSAIRIRSCNLLKFRITSEITISTIGRIMWTGNQSDARPLPTQDSTTQKDKDKHPCLKRDSNPRSQRPIYQGLCRRPYGYWDRRRFIVRFQVLTAASLKFRFVFWNILIALMMEAARTSEISVDNYFTQQYIPEDKS
jgi:hypothetical protein